MACNYALSEKRKISSGVLFVIHKDPMLYKIDLSQQKHPLNKHSVNTYIFSQGLNYYSC